VTSYRYYFGSLRTPGVITEIDCYGTFMDMELNVGGQWNGTYQLDQTGKRNEDLVDATIPGFSFVFVERNGTVVWGGYIWSRTFQSQSKSAQLYAASFEKFPSEQLLLSDFSSGVDDQRNCFISLWNHMQTRPERNLSINVPAFFPDVVFTSVAARASDLRTYGELMKAIADGNPGFDWYISCSRTAPNDYRKDLVIGYPTIGQTFSDSSLIFEYPGNVLNYFLTQSMATGATHVTVSGSGEGSKMIVGRAGFDIMLQQGWPRWDKVISAKDVSSKSAIDALAVQAATTLRAPKTTVKATMKGDKVPEFGSWGLGDFVRVVISDSFNPTTLDFPGRIVKWTLNPPSGQNTEEYAVFFENDEES
jgi:hypothetical protein